MGQYRGCLFVRFDFARSGFAFSSCSSPPQTPHREHGRSDGPSDSARRFNMIVLDENTIVQRSTVVDSPTVQNGLLLQHSQKRGRLTRIADPRFYTVKRRHISRRQRGDARQVLDEIEGRTFAG